VSDSTIDSLFLVLIERVQALEGVDTATSLNEAEAVVLSQDFVSLRDSFATAPANVKANVGYIVSAVLSLNTSRTLKNLADSLDVYFTELNSWPSSPAVPFLAKGAAVKAGASSAGPTRRAVDAFGMQGLTGTVVARLPLLLKAHAEVPNFPRFITLSHIQDIIEGEVMPVLDSTILAAKRLEADTGMELIFEVEGEYVELDLGDIYLVDAGLTMLRAACGLFVMYDLDLLTSSSDASYRWVDEFLRLQDSNRSYTSYALHGDTLHRTWVKDEYAQTAYASRILHFNLHERSEFLTIRRNTVQRTYEDLLAAPQLVKSALAAMRNEEANQTHDLFKSSHLVELDGDMVDLSQELVDGGVSFRVASNFRSPEALMDFCGELLSGPYTFSENVDGYAVNITVDLSAFFTEPVADLRSILPKYAWREEAEWRVADVHDNVYRAYGAGNTVYLYEHDNYDLEALRPFIDSIRPQYWNPRDSVAYLSVYYGYHLDRDSSVTAVPLDLVDDAGNRLDMARIEALIDSEEFFPYFDDYTMNGVFPGMTRQAWLDLIWQ